MPLQATSGAASYDAFGGGVPVVPNYIEDVFSTWLYTGTNAQQTITNGVDLTLGGLVWCKTRNTSTNHKLLDSAQSSSGNNNWDYSLTSSSTAASTYYAQVPILAQTTGFRINSPDSAFINESGNTYVSWTFRKQPKFFDIQTFTGNGVAGREISHALGSVPGFVIVKKTSAAGLWATLHKDANLLYLERTNAAASASTTAAMFGDGTNVIRPTSTVFTVGAADNVNTDGQTYVAYLFAHNAGGFGLSGTDNVISCGSFTCDGSGDATVTLGYEPQWLFRKASNEITNWEMFDNMRGLSVTNNETKLIYANLSNAEENTSKAKPTATGFIAKGEISKTYIYIAIRRGPMKVPTLGTSVYNAIARTGTGSAATVTGVGFAPDLVLPKKTAQAGWSGDVFDKLRGSGRVLWTDSVGAESADSTALTSFDMNGISVGLDTQYGGINASSAAYINWFFRRAPSFFDEVCYTGTGASSQVLTHNLTVTPQLTIFKKRSASNPWDVVSGNTSYLQLNQNFAASPDTSIAATATTITAPLGAGNGLNASGATYVAYLFASCLGVSKVGSYTGNGTTQTINCGFTGGARFVMVKATSTTGNWIIADSARGIVAGNDPALYLNSTAAEVTGLDWIDADNSGFIVNETATIAANTNGVSYIFLAVA